MTVLSRRFLIISLRRWPISCPECKTDRETYEKYWDDINPFIKFGCLKDDKFADKMDEYIIFKNLEGKYLTLKRLRRKSQRRKPRK